MKLELCPCCNWSTYEVCWALPQTRYYRRCLNCYSWYLYDDSAIDPEKYSQEYLELNQDSNDKILDYGQQFSYYRLAVNEILGKEKGSFLEIGFNNPGILLYTALRGWDSTGVESYQCTPFE